MSRKAIYEKFSNVTIPKRKLNPWLALLEKGDDLKPKNKSGR